MRILRVSGLRWAAMGVAAGSCLMLVSCGGSETASTADSKSKWKSLNPIAKLVPKRIPIAEVREGDLKKLPTGADRALAWDRHLSRKRFVFFPPKNYRPPTLPSGGEVSRGGGDGVLPALRP